MILTIILKRLESKTNGKKRKETQKVSETRKTTQINADKRRKTLKAATCKQFKPQTKKPSQNTNNKNYNKETDKQLHTQRLLKQQENADYE